MQIGDRVIINTNGQRKWADGKTGIIKDANGNDDATYFLVLIDGMDQTKPPFGLISIADYEAEQTPEVQTQEVPEENTDENDPVNHPGHYTYGKYECIDFMESRHYVADGYLFNAVKYISRAGMKDPSKYEEDLQKAIWYLERKVKYMETPFIDKITTEDYIKDKGLENTLRGTALELIDDGYYSMASKLLKIDIDTHAKHLQ